MSGLPPFARSTLLEMVATTSEPAPVSGVNDCSTTLGELVET